MIPGNAIPTTRLSVEDAVLPVKPTQAITDILSEFRPGQRVMAEIQSQLPNGTYRALVAQRDVTLALPFAAKAGDSLELEIVDSNGKLALAIAAKPGEGTAQAPNRESVTTTLSLTAQLIGNLQAKGGEGKAGAPPAALNAGQPVIPVPPRAGGAELAPLLQKAISTSGVFYESHQAAWVGGKTTQAALLLEPQGRLPPTLPPLPQAVSTPATPGALGAGVPQGASPGTAQGTASVARPGAAPPQATVAGAHSAAPNPSSAAVSTAAPLSASNSDTGASRTIAAAPPALSADAAPLVQQQLNGLATNVYAWHGLAWPGQKIEWEIVDEDARRSDGDAGEAVPQWQTQLRLSLPSLGAVDAVLRLRGQEVDITLVAAREDARNMLAAGGEALRRQYAAAGLKLAALGITAGETALGGAGEAG